jgi:hypothetical protein
MLEIRLLTTDLNLTSNDDDADDDDEGWAPDEKFR